MPAPFGVIKASYVYGNRLHAVRVYKRMIGPYLVRSFITSDGKCSSTIWIKEN